MKKVRYLLELEVEISDEHSKSTEDITAYINEKVVKQKLILDSTTAPSKLNHRTTLHKKKIDLVLSEKESITLVDKTFSC